MLKLWTESHVFPFCCFHPLDISALTLCPVGEMNCNVFMLKPLQSFEGGTDV